jgi:hypothetical protein
MGRLLVAIGLWLGLTWGVCAEIAIPPDLQPWKPWVLHDHPDITCPHLYNKAQRSCVWPGQLKLQLGAAGGQFDLQVETFAEAWVVLPGSDGYWPERVSNRGTPVSVVRREDKPQVWLPPGRHELSGVWSWSALPRTLTLPEAAGLLSLSLDGQTVSNPQRTGATELWLRGRQEEKAEPSADSFDLKVFRRLEDNNPALVETRLQLAVSGREREVVTGPLLLPGFQIRRFDSALPARVEKDGRLRVQLKPGRWEIRLLAHSDKPLTSLSYQPADELWPDQEIWVFQTNTSLRTVQLEGLPGMDPSQTQLPPEWQSLPTYLADSGATLVVRELHRGDPNPTAGQLRLNKSLWLDFAGEHFTVKDQLSGSFAGQRLEAVSAYELGRAEQDGQPLSVTRRAADGPRGVEIRSQNLNLLAVSRLANDRELPVSGWMTQFDEVSTQLHLPPGWSLLHAANADWVQGSWIGEWSLWDIFLVLVIAVGLGRATQPFLGGLALVTLVLIFQRPGSPVGIWLNFAAIFALLPFAKGKWLVWLRRYLWLSFGLLVLILLPYAVNQARQALYPQLERGWLERDSGFDWALPGSSPAPAAVSALADVDDAVEAYAERAVSKAVRARSAPMAPQQQAYDPGQKIQVGPGLPDWYWHQARLGWSGPVTQGETLQLYLVPPWLNRLGCLLAILLPLALGVLLVRQPGNHLPLPPLRFASAGIVLLLVGLALAPPQVLAQVDPQLLQTLEKRLVAPPACLPDCAAIESVVLEDGEGQLAVRMKVHVQSDLAFPLPAQVAGWYPQSVQVDGREAAWLQSRDGRLWVRLTQGAHDVQLRGTTAGREQIALAFELPLHNVRNRLRQWRLSGEPNPQQLSQLLQLQREQVQAAQEESQRLLPDPVPPYVTVSRRISVGLEWSVTTVVSRVAPEEGAIHLQVPLLPGEAPNSGQVSDGRMDVRLTPSQSSFSWQSSLRPFADMTLVAAQSQPWAEVWMLDISPSWHAAVKGLPQVAGRQNTWMPWPGESIDISISRPTAVEGAQLSLDAVRLTQNLGKRADNLSLQLQLRATQGEHYNLRLPEGAQLQRVLVDGRETPISHSDNQLKIPVNPGSHNLQLDWQSDNAGGLRTETPALDLGMPATNLRLTLQLPADRWLLLVGGPALGPALLFWGVLLVVLVLAVVLARSGLTPLKAYEWVLLSLGVATFNLYVLALIAAWFVALHFRGRREREPDSSRFNLTQVGLFLLSVIVLGALFSSIPVSLLSRPDMMVTGNGSGATYLQWYQDQSAGALPTAWVISLPLWVYRVAMLLWSLWLAFALMRWLPWAWRNLGVKGYWYQAPKKTTTPPQA